MNDLDLKVQLLLEPHERNHDFRSRFDPCSLHFRRGFKHCARLHFGNFAMDDAQAAAAETKHWIELMKFVHAVAHPVNRHANLSRQILLSPYFMWQELVQRRIEKTNCRRMPVQGFEDSDEVLPLV